MGCQSEVFIGDYLTFSICTHDPDTGILTDADSLPTYRIYEDETATSILTGTMDKLDDANTVGFYTERIACTSENGFENGKSYTIYVEATVDTVTGGISYGFRALTNYSSAILAALGSFGGSASVVLAREGTRILLRRGDTAVITFTDLGSIAGASKIWFTIKRHLSDADTESIIQIVTPGGLLYVNGSAAGDSGAGSITVTDADIGNLYVTIDESVTDDMLLSQFLYDIQVLISGTVTTLTYGNLSFLGDATRVIV